MKRIALVTIISAAAIFGVARPSLAETTIPMEDLVLVSETTSAATSLAEGIEPVAYPPFQFGRFQFPRFQAPRFQFPRFQFPRFQFPRFQFPRFQFPHPRGI